MRDLAPHMADVARRLLGEPNRALSSRHDLRFGRKGSFSVDPRKGTFFDHEANEGGGVLALVQRFTGLTGREALDWIGLPPDDQDHAPRRAPKPDRRPDPQTEADARDRTARAMRIWSEARPLAGSPAETYLRSRGCILPPDPDVLRFHPRCPRGRDRLPAMIARMTDPETNRPVGVHRTFIRPDGSGKADVTPAKQMLGNAGIVRLVEDAEVLHGLGICEGIETALAVMRAGWRPVWACLSAGGIARFPILRGITLTIFADADEAGRTAARACAQRWADAGREVVIRTPCDTGTDWNDLREAA
jgi:hypothetical protein